MSETDMNSKRRVVCKPSALHDWQSEDHFHLITSFVGSVIEFREKCGRRQRVVGTLYKCDNNSFNLIDTSINGEYFGDYVIADYEVSKWRLKKYLPKDKPNRDWLINRSSILYSLSFTTLLILNYLLKNE